MRRIQLTDGREALFISKEDGRNLCDLELSFNNGVFVSNEVDSNDATLFDGIHIERPTRFSAVLTNKEYTALSNKLRGHQKAVRAIFLPIGAFGENTEPMWEFTLEFVHEESFRIPNVNVVDMDNGIASLKVDGIEVDHLHQIDVEKLNSSWNLSGENRYRTMKHLVALLTKPIYIAA